MQVSVKRGFPSPKRTRYVPRPQQKSVVLLDFDGVVSNIPAANMYVSNRIINIVKYVTGVKDDDTAKALNSDLYKAHGHTWLGLRELGYEITLNDFNEGVYGDKCSYNAIHLTQTETFNLFSFMMRSMHMDIDVMLFSNADHRWLTQFLKWDPTLYAIQDHVVSKYGTLKPTYESYDRVNTFLQSNGYEKVFFIDDKLENITNAPIEWNNIWFSDKEHPDTHICNNLKTACELMKRLR